VLREQGGRAACLNAIGLLDFEESEETRGMGEEEKVTLVCNTKSVTS
jgi:hypothetical protein